MNKFLMILTATLALMFTSVSMAGTSEVTWTNPDDYRDVDAGEGHRGKFKAKVFSDFEEHFAKLAEALPEGQTLKVEVVDVDLAGDVNHGGMRRIRVIKDLYSPRLEFNYQVVDQNGNEVKAGKEDIRDMNFMMGSTMKYSNDTLQYEKKMLDDWFRDTFEK